MIRLPQKLTNTYFELTIGKSNMFTRCLLALIYTFFLVSCSDEGNDTILNIDTTPEKKVYYPVDSGSWDGKDTVYNEYGMRKIFAKGYSFYPQSRERARCTLTYNYYIDTTEITEIQFENLAGHLIPNFEISEQFSRPASANVEHAILYCNERSKKFNFDTVYTYDSVAIDSTFGYPYNHLLLVNAKMNLAANGFRLPLSSEWTYAYRGGYSSDYFWGNDLFDEDVADQYGWYRYKGGESGALPVAGKLPNPYGLYDIIGNAKESVHFIHIEDTATFLIDPITCEDTITGFKYLASMGADWTSRPPYQHFNAYGVEHGTGFGFRTVLPEEIPDTWNE